MNEPRNASPGGLGEFQKPIVAAPVAKRSRYVSRACLECQKRKTKCTGEQPCQQCCVVGVDCIYNTGRFRKRRQTTRTQPDVPIQTPNGSPTTGHYGPSSIMQASRSDGVNRETPTNTSQDERLFTQIDTNWKAEVIARITAIEQRLIASDERDSTILHTQSNFSPGSRDQILSSPASHGERTAFLPDEEEAMDMDHASPKAQGGTDLMTPIAMLDRIVGPSEVEKITTTDPSNQRPAADGCRFTDCTNFPECCASDLQMWTNRTKPEDVDNLRASFQTFFSCLNPHYLCLHESYFLSRFESYLIGDQTWSNTVDSHQFVALINLVVAVVKILEEYSSDSKVVPGWKDFNRAEHLLSHTTWLGRGNLLTIQCLILKTLYFLFIEKRNAAYDAISTAVRLTYQVGLHDQGSWQSNSPFETTMRQRVFWCLYCLDRNVALVCGVPYLIRESYFKVDLPKCVDKDDISASKPSSESECLSLPYLYGTIKWAKLCSEIWDAMFGMNASNLTSQEFVATMDARISLLIHDLPPRLQWQPNFLESPEVRKYPLFVLRQNILLKLRTNHLRLLLRRKEMVSLQYHTQAAEACTTIASSSIDAIHAFHTSKFHQRTDRYSSVIYLAGAIIPLTCIIIKEECNENDKILRSRASEAFHKALALLQDISPGHTFARRMLQRLRRIVDAANKKIVSRRSGNESNSTQFEGQVQRDISNGTHNANSYTSNLVSFGDFQYQNDILDGLFAGDLMDMGGGNMPWSTSEMDRVNTLFDIESSTATGFYY